jgi:gluconate kinase
LILFGLPGAGKSYAGRLLRDAFGYHFYEADDDIPADYRALVAAGQVVSEDRRDAYHRALLERLAELRAQHPRLAVAVPLLRDRHRRWIAERFPGALFLLVQCAPDPWAARLAGRAHTIGLDYARVVSALYEPPTIPHHRLDNTAGGPASLHAQLAPLLSPPPSSSSNENRPA